MKSQKRSQLNNLLFESSNNYDMYYQQQDYHNNHNRYKNYKPSSNPKLNNYNQSNILDDYQDHYQIRNYQNNQADISNNSIISPNHQHQHQNQDDQVDFPRDDARSFQFSASCGISLVHSKGHQLDNSNHLLPPKHPNNTQSYQNLLKAKERQQQRLNQIIQEEKIKHTRQIDTKNCIIQGLKKQCRDLQQQNSKKKKQVEKHFQKNRNLQNMNKQLTIKLKQQQQQKGQFFQLLDGKDVVLKQYQNGLSQLKNQNYNINLALDSLSIQNQELKVYIRELTGNQQGFTDFSTRNNKKSQQNTLSSKQIERLKKQNKRLQRQLQQITNKHQQAINKLKKNFQNSEKQYKKELSLKQKRIQDIQEAINTKQDQIKKLKQLNLKNNQSTQNMKSRTALQSKQLLDKQNKVIELQMRVKSLHDDSKTKEQKIRDLVLQVTEKNKTIQSINKNYNQIKIKSDNNDKWVLQRQTQLDKKDKIINILKTQKETLQKQLTNLENKLKKELEYSKTQLLEANEQIQKLQKQKRQKQLQSNSYKSKFQSLNKDYKKKLQENNKKSVNQTERYQKLQQMIADQQEQLQKRGEKIQELTKESNQMKKKVANNRQLSNKIKILQSRLSKEGYDSQDTLDINAQKIQFLESVIREKDVQIKSLKKQILKKSKQYSKQCSSPNSIVAQQDIEQLQQEIYIRDQQIQNLQKQLDFKEKSLDFLHNKLMEIQKQKLQSQAEKKRLQSSFYDTSYDHQADQQKRELELKINQLIQVIHQKNDEIKSLQRKLRDKQQKKYYNPQKDARFQIAQLKTRIKQLNNMLLNRQKMISPQSLSQTQTVDLLIKIVKRVNTSSQMLRLLGVNSQFKKSLVALQKQLSL